MEIDPSALEGLLESVCGNARVSVRQSKASVIRQSWRRLSVNALDSPARHVVAASSLVRQQPARTLEILACDSDSFQRHPVSNRLAAYAWLVRKDVSRARRHFDQSVRLDPNQPDCWNWLGRLAEQDDEDEQAAEYYERGILFDDGGHDSALALSRLHAKNRQLADAIHTLRVCLIRDRRSPKLNLALARLLDRRAVLLGRRRKFLAQQRLRQESLECYRTVNASAPTSQSLVMQGRLEQQLLDHAGAKESFGKAVNLDADSAGPLSHLAAANVDFGEIDIALSQFEKSLSMDPTRADTHFRYTRAKRFKADHGWRHYVEQLKHQLMTTRLQNQRQKQIYLNFALAKLHDDIGDFDQAWLHYHDANRLKVAPTQSPSKQPTVTAARPSTLGTFAEHAASRFTAEFFEEMKGGGNPSRTPIFIVGMPRSGTTLTEQILSSHREVAGAGELNYINQIRQEMTRSHADQTADARQQGCRYPDLLTTVGASAATRWLS